MDDVMFSCYVTSDPESSTTLCLEEVRQVAVPDGRQTTAVFVPLHQHAAALRVKSALIHDLLFLPISTIESAVGKRPITHCCVSRLACLRLSGHIEPHSPRLQA